MDQRKLFAAVTHAHATLSGAKRDGRGLSVSRGSRPTVVGAQG